MDNLQRASVSLLIDEDDLVPSEITALLGAEPRLGVAKGEKFLGSHGKCTEASTGKWQLGGDWNTPVDLNDQISTLLARLTDDLEVWKYLTARYHCYMSVGGYFVDWTGGITLAPQTLGALSARGLAIDFDLYAHTASE
ncbi:hypothetical protein C1T17_11630 [Sphingobium sp. SCG-1]|uniref:DUF4279 domain-containing protein n=1 Tax=Sphingobium sp. SCG-1 TaxID=2072936 RepID=UPI000CD68AB2|nr:DUF4279 domain-containing protein [Sphingobium sp. SCG-1]AUW57900.1 hypothetical protein C1T17_07065 [Sphingobium sp. SCG-1]AUW58212.1 hypothetical protein C1T17_08935 [Sphingobium sp. SCG-1]AUW58653.1 hypothetical protein C1T17_11630 [Sphingobium sp. SCG-1]